MDKMTAKKFMQMSLKDCPLDITANTRMNNITIDHPDLDGTVELDLDCLDIELIPEIPKISQENLCKFFLKHERWPTGIVRGCATNRDIINYEMSIIGSYIGDCHGKSIRYYRVDSDSTCWYSCEITDDDWPHLLEDES